MLQLSSSTLRSQSTWYFKVYHQHSGDRSLTAGAVDLSYWVPWQFTLEQILDWHWHRRTLH